MECGSPDLIWPWQPVYEADRLGEGGGPFLQPGPWQWWWWGAGGGSNRRSWEPSQDMNQGHGCPEGLQLTGAVDPGLLWPPLRACKKLPKLEVS